MITNINIFTELAPRPIQYISRNFCGKSWRVVPYCVYFLKVMLLPFTKVPGQNDLLQKYSLQKSNERKVVSEFATLAPNWSKIVPHNDSQLFSLCKPSCFAKWGS